MKAKKEYLILAVIIAGLVAYLFSQKKGEVHYTLPQLPALQKEAVDHLTVKKGEGTISIARDKDRWRIQPEGFSADTTLVDEMIEKGGDLRLTALASESQNYGVYQLTDGEKIAVVLAGGDTVLRQIDIGKRAPSSRHTFVKLENDPRVFHADGDLVTLFDKTVSDLRDKVVMKIDEDMGEIAVAAAGKTVTLVKSTLGAPADGSGVDQDPGADAPKTDAHWQRQTGESVDHSQVEALLAHLKKLRCDRFVHGKTKADLVDPAYSISLTGSKPYHLSIFPPPEETEEAQGYRGISSQSDYPFILPDWKAKQIMKAADALAQGQPEDH